MNLQFDLQNITLTEFGVGRDRANNRAFCLLPVDQDVQEALGEMASSTWQCLQGLGNDSAAYEPSEKYASQENLHLNLNDGLAGTMCELHQSSNLPLDVHALDDPGGIFCYFAQFKDNKKRKLTALRRATQFKGIVRSRLIRLVTDALKLIPDNVFKLDADFDLLIDNQRIHILRPSGFEFVGQLQEAILAAVPTTIKAIRRDLGFVDFATIQEFAGSHPRAARYLASIRSQGEASNISKTKLESLCRTTGVEFTHVNGQIHVEDRHIMGFLEVLDRRRYELELVEGEPEQYRAASRSRLQRAAGRTR